VSRIVKKLEVILPAAVTPEHMALLGTGQDRGHSSRILTLGSDESREIPVALVRLQVLERVVDRKSLGRCRRQERVVCRNEHGYG
jgi:hypothetical protein